MVGSGARSGLLASSAGRSAALTVEVAAPGCCPISGRALLPAGQTVGCDRVPVVGQAASPERFSSRSIPRS